MTETESIQTCDATTCLYANILKCLSLDNLAIGFLQLDGKINLAGILQIEYHGTYLILRTIDHIDIVARRPNTVKCHTICVEGEFRNVERVNQRFLVSKHIRT